MSLGIIINYYVELIDQEDNYEEYYVKGRTELNRNSKFKELKIFFNYVN